MSERPLIDATLDFEEAGGWSSQPWYALREIYCRAVSDAGGLPVLRPHEPEQAAAYAANLDGLGVTGGAFDVDPALFGARTRHATTKTKDRRTTPDGVIEGIEAPRFRVCLGVRWHPEYAVSSGATAIFRAFAGAADV